MISAYKPSASLEQRFSLRPGAEENAWEFVRQHLRQLPVFVRTVAGKAEVVAERQKYLLYDRMLAFHIQRNVSVPLSAPEFYEGLSRDFLNARKCISFPSRD